MSLFCVSISTFLLLAFYPTASHGQQLQLTRRAARILDRIAQATSSVLVKPAIVVGKTPSIGQIEPRRKYMLLDSGVFHLADSYGANADAYVALIIGHELAHYVRGQDFNDRYLHNFGGFASVKQTGGQIGEVLVKQGEYEADYYGVFYTLLAGYRLSLDEILTFYKDLGRAYGLSEDISLTHPTREERGAIADTVLRQIKKMIYVHHFANASLLSGKYFEASLLYEWINQEILIPQVAWNELIARFLAYQGSSNRQAIDPTLLVGKAAFAPTFRGTRQMSELDREQLIYRCESLVASLSALRYAPQNVAIVSQGIALVRSISECSSCSETGQCGTHFDESGRLSKDLKLLDSSIVTEVKDAEELGLAERMFKVTTAIDIARRSALGESIDLAIGRMTIWVIPHEEGTLLSMSLSGPRSLDKYRIDAIVSYTKQVDQSAIYRSDAVIRQRFPGYDVTSSLLAR